MTKEREYTPTLINEVEAGIREMTNSLEESFGQSCEYNGTTKEDGAYFRSYLWAVIAMLAQRIEELEAGVGGSSEAFVARRDEL